MKKILLILILLLIFQSGCSKKDDTSPTLETTQSNDTTLTSENSVSEGTENDLKIEDNKINLSETTEWMPDILPEKEEIYTDNIYENNFDWEPVDVLDDEELSFATVDIPIITQTTPLQDMLTEIDDISYIVISGSDMTVAYPSRRGHATLEQVVSRDYNGTADTISRKIPVNFLRKMESGGYYTVVSMKNGGYAYFIFYYDPKDTETIYNWGCIYSEKAVSYSDFSNIKPGDSIIDVINIDPSAKLSLAEIQYERDIFGVKEFSGHSQLMLLTDGLLEIIYELRDMTPVKETVGTYSFEYVPMDSDDLVVKEIKYFPDFIYHSTKAMEYYGVDTALPIEILPQDYPPAE